MRVRYAALLAVLLLGLCAGQGRAQGSSSIVWTPLYPQPGATTGSIKVNGTVTVDPTWILPNTAVKIQAWQDGLEVTAKDIMLTKGMMSNTYTFDDSITGLQSGAEYNVTIQVQVARSPEGFVTIATAPGRSLAK